MTFRKSTLVVAASLLATVTLGFLIGSGILPIRTAAIAFAIASGIGAAALIIRIAGIRVALVIVATILLVGSVILYRGMVLDLASSGVSSAKGGAVAAGGAVTWLFGLIWPILALIAVIVMLVILVWLTNIAVAIMAVAGVLLLVPLVWATGWEWFPVGIVLLVAVGIRAAGRLKTSAGEPILKTNPTAQKIAAWVLWPSAVILAFVFVTNWWTESVEEAEVFQAKVDAEEKALRDKALEPVVLACGGEGYVRWNDYQKAVGVAVFIVPAAEGKECVTGEVILPREIRAARRRSGDRISVRRSYSNGTKDKSFVEYEPTRIVRLGKTPRGWTFKNTGTEPVEQKFEAMR